MDAWWVGTLFSYRQASFLLADLLLTYSLGACPNIDVVGEIPACMRSTSTTKLHHYHAQHFMSITKRSTSNISPFDLL